MIKSGMPHGTKRVPHVWLCGEFTIFKIRDDRVSLGGLVGTVTVGIFSEATSLLYFVKQPLSVLYSHVATEGGVHVLWTFTLQVQVISARMRGHPRGLYLGARII